MSPAALNPTYSLSPTTTTDTPLTAIISYIFQLSTPQLPTSTHNHHHHYHHHHDVTTTITTTTQAVIITAALYSQPILHLSRPGQSRSTRSTMKALVALLLLLGVLGGTGCHAQGSLVVGSAATDYSRNKPPPTSTASLCSFGSEYLVNNDEAVHQAGERDVHLETKTEKMRTVQPSFKSSLVSLSAPTAEVLDLTSSTVGSKASIEHPVDSQPQHDDEKSHSAITSGSSSTIALIAAVVTSFGPFASADNLKDYGTTLKFQPSTITLTGLPAPDVSTTSSCNVICPHNELQDKCNNPPYSASCLYQSAGCHVTMDTPYAPCLTMCKCVVSRDIPADAQPGLTHKEDDEFAGLD
ncbi:hypothetical protein M406DRAFT_66239 [Cryphonectria parasitica EP155]|uniref:Uncharacterized protein n=1 Tax=Cryphonectria parasitica (strain ATCC 38755 / EP155) TaxID=660469 RepID=A0A9P4YAF1_CRYP1|nr:uncharacterized protein M406DRAFT_66239 [Cryphonectria parasitica EP155]KAF3769768.1 hypothetical protein M406DRAFT_66239 [Cryphonectria parasitica EP155]